MQHLHPTIAAAQPERQAEQARALAHYAGMAAQAALIDSPVAEHLRRIDEGKRRATDERDQRRAAMRKAIKTLVDVSVQANERGFFSRTEREACAAKLYDAEMAVEALLGEMR